MSEIYLEKSKLRSYLDRSARRSAIFALTVGLSMLHSAPTISWLSGFLLQVNRAATLQSPARSTNCSRARLKKPFHSRRSSPSETHGSNSGNFAQASSHSATQMLQRSSRGCSWTSCEYIPRERQCRGRDDRIIVPTRSTGVNSFGSGVRIGSPNPGPPTH